MPYSRYLAISILLAALVPGCGGPQAQPPAPLDEYPTGLEQLSRLDLLPRFKHSTKVGMFSSYDRTGGNDDGFQGTYSFLRKEDDGGLVLAELEGPGEIFRIWTPTPTDDLFDFYFDGEAEPRLTIPFRQLFTGERPPFVAPIVGYGAGGFFSYLPIPFAKSIKIVARAEQIRFYQINYALYAPETAVKTYDGYQSAEEQAQLTSAQQTLGASRADLSRIGAPRGDQVETDTATSVIQPGESKVLWQTSCGGRIVGLRLGPTEVLARKDRAVTLKIFWDDAAEPAVLAPAGDFFGYSFGEPAAQSALLGSADKHSYAYFPMPFDRSARIELSLEADASEPVEVWADVMHAATPRAEDEGRFYAQWRRENPTTEGQPFTFLDLQGRGHVVGAVLQAQGHLPANTGFFEGDDQTWIDGELVAHGTGSEDFFNGGWYNVIGRWMSRTSFPFSGCLDYVNPLSRTGGYRFFLTDSLPFRESVKLTIEHGPEGNRAPTDYAGMAYWYAEQPPAAPLTLAEDRAVHAPEKIVFRPGWSVPVDSFSLDSMTLTKEIVRLDNRPVRYLKIRAQGEDRFGPHSVAFQFDLPEAGLYRVSIEPIQGPDQAVVQVFRHEKAEGAAADLYAPSRAAAEPIVLGELPMQEGENVVLFKLTGKNARSTGLGFDLVSVIFERVAD